MRDVAKRELEEHGAPKYHRKIVNFFSTAAIRGNPGQINYTAAKMGNVGITRTVAQEWGRFWINVNAVAPGFTNTRLTAPKQKGDELGVPEEQRQAMLQRIPLGRFGEPEDIANAVPVLLVAAVRLRDRSDDQRLGRNADPVARFVYNGMMGVAAALLLLMIGGCTDGDAPPAAGAGHRRRRSTTAARRSLPASGAACTTACDCTPGLGCEHAAVRGGGGAGLLLRHGRLHRRQPVRVPRRHRQPVRPRRRRRHARSTSTPAPRRRRAP